jgi:hypothetical protein
MEAAAVEPGDDPMQNQDHAEQAQRQRRLLTARTHPLAQQPGIEEGERRHHHGGENRHIDPEVEDFDRAGRGEQDDRVEYDEQRRLDIGRNRHDQLRVPNLAPALSRHGTKVVMGALNRKSAPAARLGRPHAYIPPQFVR